MIKADKEADVTWRMIILRSRQMVLLRGVMTTVIILTSRSMLRSCLNMIKADKEADVTWRTIILRSRQMDIDDKTVDVENVFKSDYNEKTLDDVLDGNVINA